MTSPATRQDVSHPIIVLPIPGGPLFVVRPCNWLHREIALDGYLVLSCKKCRPTRLDQETP